MADRKLTTWEVLRYKFPAAEYVLLEEVSNFSGFSRSRSLDFILVNLWESRGLAITGIERKSNRGDWLKEIKNPAKQETHFKYCDYFYLLTDRPDVAKLEEIPINWGWYYINEKQILKTMKSAPKLESIPVHRSLLCAMLRRAASKEKYVHIDSIQTRIDEELQKKRDSAIYQYEVVKKKLTDLQSEVAAFESASGIKITQRWDAKATQVGEAVKYVLNGGAKDEEKKLGRLLADFVHLHEVITERLKMLKSTNESTENTSDPSMD